VGHVGADGDHPIFEHYLAQLRDAGDVHQAIGGPPALGQLDDQVSAASHQARSSLALGQHSQRFLHRGREKVFLPH